MLTPHGEKFTTAVGDPAASGSRAWQNIAKRRRVIEWLLDPENRGRSDRACAREVSVSQPFAGKVRVWLRYTLSLLRDAGVRDVGAALEQLLAHAEVNTSAGNTLTVSASSENAGPRLADVSHGPAVPLSHAQQVRAVEQRIAARAVESTSRAAAVPVWPGHPEFRTSPHLGPGRAATEWNPYK
jgi:hypothetical protein